MDLIQVRVTIIDNGPESQFEYSLLKCMSQELRLMHDVFTSVAEIGQAQIPNMAETFTRLVTLGLDAALKIYGMARFDFVSKELRSKVKGWW